jgi:hypothetical protein
VLILPQRRRSIETRLAACLRGSSVDIAAEAALYWDEIGCLPAQQQG